MSKEKVRFLKTQSNSDTSLAARTHFRQKGERLSRKQAMNFTKNQMLCEKCILLDFAPDINERTEPLGR
jgi:hypothetical protein